MTVALVALLAGLFVVPAALLAVGHRLRRRSPRVQSAFWGAIVAHIVAALIVVVFSMTPPEEWRPSDITRGAISFWSLLIAPLVGAAFGAMFGASKSQISS